MSTSDEVKPVVKPSKIQKTGPPGLYDLVHLVSGVNLVSGSGSGVPPEELHPQTWSKDVAQ